MNNATTKVGTKADKINQSKVTIDPSALNKDSITRALKIQTGIYFNQRNTTSGNSIFLTKIKGMIRGSHVTNAQPSINNTIGIVVVIFQSPPQSLQQSPLQLKRLNALVQNIIIHIK